MGSVVARVSVKDGQVVDTAPVYGWMRGKPWSTIVPYLNRRHADIRKLKENKNEARLEDD